MMEANLAVALAQASQSASENSEADRVRELLTHSLAVFYRLLGPDHQRTRRLAAAMGVDLSEFSPREADEGENSNPG